MMGQPPVGTRLVAVDGTDAGARVNRGDHQDSQDAEVQHLYIGHSATRPWPSGTPRCPAEGPETPQRRRARMLFAAVAAALITVAAGGIAFAVFGDPSSSHTRAAARASTSHPRSPAAVPRPRTVPRAKRA